MKTYGLQSPRLVRLPSGGMPASRPPALMRRHLLHQAPGSAAVAQHLTIVRASSFGNDFLDAACMEATRRQEPSQAATPDHDPRRRLAAGAAAALLLLSSPVAAPPPAHAGLPFFGAPPTSQQAGVSRGSGGGAALEQPEEADFDVEADDRLVQGPLVREFMELLEPTTSGGPPRAAGLPSAEALERARNRLGISRTLDGRLRLRARDGSWHAVKPDMAVRVGGWLDVWGRLDG